MKKILIVLLIFIAITPIYSLKLNTSINYKTTQSVYPLYLSLNLHQKIDMVTISGVYNIGHDFKNNIAYNAFEVSIEFNAPFGIITLSNMFGSESFTQLRLEF